MQAWALLAAPRGNARAQWPESNSAIEMMENPLFSVNSDTATWLSPRASTWGRDMILAFVCGLVLFLLLLPYLPSNPSPPTGKKNFTKHQVHRRGHSNIRKKSGALKGKGYPLPSDETSCHLSLSHQSHVPEDVCSRLLRDCRACGKKLKELQNLALLLAIHYKGSSLGAEGDITPNPFWNKEGKPEPLPSPRELSYPKLLWELMEQKCSQLFWGLPSLLYESLVATAWVSKKSSAAQPKAVLFKGLSSSFPNQPEVEEPPQLSETQPLRQDVAQPKCVMQILPSVAEGQTPAPMPSSPPDQPPTSPSQMGPCRAACPTSQVKTQWFVPTENEHLDWPFQNQLKWKKVSASKHQEGGEAISQPTLSLPEGSQGPQTSQSASLLAEDSESPEPWGLMEPHSPERLIKNEKHQDPPSRFPVAQELMQPRGKFPWPTGCQAEDKPGPPLRSALTFESNSSELRKEPTCPRRPSKQSPVAFKQDHPRQHLEQDPGRVLESLPWSSESTLEKGLEDKDGSGSHLRARKCHSGSLKSKDKKYRETLLQSHLGRKAGQIRKGLIPVRVRRSWLAADRVYPGSSIQKGPMMAPAWKLQLAGVDTSQVLPFLDPQTRQMLEIYTVRSRVRHWRGPHLQAMGPVNHNSRDAPASPLLQLAFPSSASQDPKANSLAKVAEPLEGLPRKCPGEKAVKKSPHVTVQSPLPAPSPAQLQRLHRELAHRIQKGVLSRDQGLFLTTSC